MPANVTTTSNEGFASSSTIRDFHVEIDPRGEAAPDTIESLLAAYAACYVPALRVTADRRELGELGAVTIEVVGDLDDNGKLDGVTFDVDLEADLGADERETLIEGANALCKVHAALRESLRASVAVNGHPVH